MQKEFKVPEKGLFFTVFVILIIHTGPSLLFGRMSHHQKFLLTKKEANVTPADLIIQLFNRINSKC